MRPTAKRTAARPLEGDADAGEDARAPTDSEADLPDARDGLTRRERIVLNVLRETQRERGGRSVPTTMLWGRVCEHFWIEPAALSEMLARLGARK